MNTVYLIKDGYLRLEPNYSIMSLQVNQQDYELILGNGMFLPSCITPIQNFETYTEGQQLRREDIPDYVDFVDLGDDHYKLQKGAQTFAAYKELLINRINEDYIKDYQQNEVYIGDTIYKYSEKDRIDMSIAVAAGVGGYYNCKYYAPQEYKELFYNFENELARLSYYKQVLIDLVNTMPFEDYLADTQVAPVWGMYTEVVSERMDQFEEPFK